MRIRFALITAALCSALIAGCSSSSSGGGPISNGTSPAAIDTSPTASTSSPATKPKPGKPQVSTEAEADAASNLRVLATAEEVFFTDQGSYTTAREPLLATGYAKFMGSKSQIVLAGVNSLTNYCLVGAPSAAGPWYLYDSKVRGGFIHDLFNDRDAAESACSDSSISSYSRIY